MQMFCPMAQESSQLHTMKITLLSGVADPDVQRYFRFLYKISIRHSLPDLYDEEIRDPSYYKGRMEA